MPSTFGDAPNEFSGRDSLDEDDAVAATEADPEESLGLLLESSFISDAGLNMFGEIGRRTNHKLDVFLGIHRTITNYLCVCRVRRLVMTAIEDPFTAEQLRGPRLNKLVVRPLVERLYDAHDLSLGEFVEHHFWVAATTTTAATTATTTTTATITTTQGRTSNSSPSLVYCLLTNRIQFQRSQTSRNVQQSVTLARATLCEILAIKVLRRFHEDNSGLPGLLLLANVLVAGYDPFQGAPPEIHREARLAQWPVQDRGGHERKLTALELAVLSESKSFLASRACVKVVTSIHEGRVTFTPLSFMDILPDHYKHHPVALYDPSKAPVLNHYRLKVPRSRNIIELYQFVLMTVLYFLAMAHRNSPWMEVFEPLFCIYTLGWIIEFVAAIIEHGWEVHSQALWSFLDVAFSFIFLCYSVTRLTDIFMELPSAYSYGLDIICLAAPILLTRLAFTIMPDNIVFISMHAMLKDFFRLNFLVMWCFAGFSMSLIWLLKESGNSDEATDNPSYLTTVKWLIWIWFGLDATGIEKSTEYHSIFGPLLTISFAFLGNILFLTILVAILTNRFSNIMADADAEIQFRRTVLTFQGVKSDSVFMYPVPFNLLALVCLLPLKFFVSPRLFHSINVFFIRVINAPTLALIYLYERQHFNPRPRARSQMWSLFGFEFSRFSPHADLDAVFDLDLPQSLLQELEKMDPLEQVSLLEGEPMLQTVPSPMSVQTREQAGRNMQVRARTWQPSASTATSL
ncbi:hypothetical protein TD95_004096 [Thielaviopsis punctulata]|uniref:Ion transport domain-containing protein n=1 Tax=Thielaviopsis punctulata TaxID=72032 RepID=A0A0F4ZAE9_9PEZI|nr:hypothetical protein TD95_004096 [Thielaviopsis punctulata]